MKIGSATVMLAGVLVALPATAQTRERQKESLEGYLPYAGEPVDRFQFWGLKQWELVDTDKVVVWPRLNQAFLLTVDRPCSELEWAQAISVTSTTNTVSRGFDSVKAGRDTCRINEIRPIDIRKYRAGRDRAKKSAAES